jgi:hypothetical protein
MRTGRSRGGLLTRLERLESRVVREEHRLKLRFGRLKRLPQDYKGEKHVVMAKQLPSRNGQEWVEFEEVPGADPHPKPLQAVKGSPRYLNLMFVKAYPWPEEDRGFPAQTCGNA